MKNRTELVIKQSLKGKYQVIGKIYNLTIEDSDIKEISKWGKVFLLHKKKSYPIRSVKELNFQINFLKKDNL